MKILVPIKQVPDTATQVKVSSDPRAIETAGVTWIISPYDEFALEEALRIREKRGQGEVVTVSLGPDRVKEALRSSLAMGADRAIHVNDPAFAEADTLLTARALAAVIAQEAPQLAIFGRQVEGGLEVFEAPLPCVLAAQKGLNEPRYPTLKGIMGARKKEIKDLKAGDLGLAPEPAQLSVVRLEALPPRPPGRILGGELKDAVHELVRALREEAKAI